MSKVKILLALLVCAFLLAPMGFAKDMWEMADSEVYKEKAGAMLGRGLLNVATSPVDIFVQTVNRSKEGPALIGTLTGMAGGLGCTALRASSGIVDAGLFWVPGFNGFPVNRSYDNCLIEASDEFVQPVYQAPVSFQPSQSFQPSPAVTEAAPIVTVTESESAPVKKLVKKHNAYDYVKK